MPDYAILTDMTADLPEKYCEEKNIYVFNYNFMVGDTEYTDIHQLPIKDFYTEMRAGKMTRTSQVQMETIRSVFSDFLEQGKNVIYFAFSSALSGTFSTASAIAEELREEYPDRKVYVVDTLCASLGEGLFVMKAVEKAEEGLTIDELYQWSIDTRLSVIHLFTVDDLMFLHRGGRVSKTAAVAGSILGIKPVLHVSDEGKLVPVKKIRGRKQSLIEMVNMMEAQMGNAENPYIAISHGDCIEDAELVANEIKKRFGIKKAVINFVGPIVGAHSGPGTVALFFMGEKR